MSRRRTYKDETLGVISRFFEAIELLKASGKIRGASTYCRMYEIDHANFCNQRKDHNKGYFEISWILPLITDFNILSNWLLFGKGKMFRETKKEELK